MFFAAAEQESASAATSNTILRRVFMASIVQVSGLTKQVLSGDQPLTILHDVTFSVETGESIAIVGASGSGKSTLLGLLAGLDVPSNGKVLLRGGDLVA